MINLAVLASGSGSNALRLFEYFKNHPSISVQLVVSDRKAAGVYAHAQAFGIESLYFPKSVFFETPELILEKLLQNQIDFILLAGFLLLLPDQIISVFERKILNIHPALLPKFGGAGMYGQRVHEAVKVSGDMETGMTVHEVNGEFDAGKIIFQARCPVFPSDSVSDIAGRVLQLEHEHYSFVAEQFIRNSNRKKQNK
ncbi:MAG TPA: formyltransferase family protein [Catalimonadaceae bacterium]|nr:formyltransferase family protein [Catalimonadaceae bacterium]